MWGKASYTLSRTLWACVSSRPLSKEEPFLPLPSCPFLGSNAETRLQPFCLGTVFLQPQLGRQLRQ